MRRSETVKQRGDDRVIFPLWLSVINIQRFFTMTFMVIMFYSYCLPNRNYIWRWLGKRYRKQPANILIKQSCLTEHCLFQLESSDTHRQALLMIILCCITFHFDFTADGHLRTLLAESDAASSQCRMLPPRHSRQQSKIATDYDQTCHPSKRLCYSLLGLNTFRKPFRRVYPRGQYVPFSVLSASFNYESAIL